MNLRAFRYPRAYLPLLMSLAALTLLFGHVWRYGVIRGEDEGAAAHLFQGLMTVQLPIMLYALVIGWRVAPRKAAVLALVQGAFWLGTALAAYRLT